jgi:hypothetical protein
MSGPRKAPNARSAGQQERPCALGGVTISALGRNVSEGCLLARPDALARHDRERGQCRPSPRGRSARRRFAGAHLDRRRPA